MTKKQQDTTDIVTFVIVKKVQGTNIKNAIDNESKGQIVDIYLDKATREETRIGFGED